MKKYIVIIIAIMSICISEAFARNVTTYGVCGAEGDSVIWSLTEDSVLTIGGCGQMANWDCDSIVPWIEVRSCISKLLIGDSVASIANYALNGCYNLKKVVWGKNVRRIGYKAFCGCEALTEITFPEKLVWMEKEAFEDCSALKRLETPKTLTVLCDNVFRNCVSLETVVLKEGLKVIGNSAFGNCLMLTDIIIPNTVKELEDFAFSGCANAERLSIGCGVEKIGNRAFAQCSSLKDVIVPNSVTWIGNGAFYGCEHISSMKMSENIRHIGSTAFMYNRWWNELPKGPVYFGKLLYRYINNGYSGNLDDNTVLNVREGTEVICDEALFSERGLIKVVMPNTVKVVGRKAFYACLGLEDMVLSENIEEIGEGAFYENPWIADCEDGEMYIGKILFGYRGIMPEEYVLRVKTGTVEIGKEAMYDQKNLIEVILPKSLRKIGKSSFGACYNLKKIGWETDSCKMVGMDTDKTDTLKINNTQELKVVGIGALNDTQWWNANGNGGVYLGNVLCGCKGEITGEMMIKEGTKYIGDGAMSGCTKMTGLVVPESLLEIDRNALFGCNAIQKVVWNAVNCKTEREGLDLGSIFENAASNLNEIDLGDAVVQIPDCLFAGMSLIRSLKIPKSVENVGEWAFAGCKNVDSLMVAGNSIPNICVNTFEGVDKDICVVVEREMISKYEAHEYWREFRFIADMENDTIPNKPADPDEPEDTATDNTKYNEIEVWTECGCVVLGDSETMFEVRNVTGVVMYKGNGRSCVIPNGVYIVLGDGWIRKIIV